MKLVVPDEETADLRVFLRDEPDQYSSAVVHVELVRALRRRSAGLVPRAEGVLRQLSLVEVDDEIRQRAALLDPPELRSLDALHLATALGAEDAPDRFLTYDRRLAEAAGEAGFAVLSPGA